MICHQAFGEATENNLCFLAIHVTSVTDGPLPIEHRTGQRFPKIRMPLEAWDCGQFALVSLCRGENLS